MRKANSRWSFTFSKIQATKSLINQEKG